MVTQKMIKISEFAKRFGISDRHARRLAAECESDISGHIEKRGSGGTWIDEVAVEILRSRLRNPIEMLPSPSEDPDPDTLQGKIQELQEDLVQAYRALSEERCARVALLEELGQQRLLAAKTESERERADRAEARAVVAEDRAEQSERVAIEATKRKLEAEKHAQAAEDIAEMNAQEADRLKGEKNAAEARAAAADEEVDRLRSELEAMKKRGLWARILNK